MDAGGAIGPVARFRHAGLAAGNKMCIIMSEYFC